VNLAIPYIDRIWRAEGHISLDDVLSPQEAFDRLDPLFQTPGTQYAIEGDTLAYAKTNPAAQDKLATFTKGTLRIEPVEAGSRLFFNVTSTALLLCFLAPLLFLGYAQLAGTINEWERAKAEAAASSDDKKSEDKDKKKKIELHPIDVMLGAPAPKDPDADKDKDKKKEPKEKFKTTPAYVLAGLFFLIYLVGRFLEPWLLKRTLRQALAVRPYDQTLGADHSGTPDSGFSERDKPPSALSPHG
jgi:hypothetical protein